MNADKLRVSEVGQVDPSLPRNSEILAISSLSDEVAGDIMIKVEEATLSGRATKIYALLGEAFQEVALVNEWLIGAAKVNYVDGRDFPEIRELLMQVNGAEDVDFEEARRVFEDLNKAVQMVYFLYKHSIKAYDVVVGERSDFCSLNSNALDLLESGKISVSENEGIDDSYKKEMLSRYIRLENVFEENKITDSHDVVVYVRNQLEMLVRKVEEFRDLWFKLKFYSDKEVLREDTDELVVDVKSGEFEEDLHLVAMLAVERYPFERDYVAELAEMMSRINDADDCNRLVLTEEVLRLLREPRFDIHADIRANQDQFGLLFSGFSDKVTEE